MLLACQRQIGLAPSSHIIAIDRDAALTIGAARGSDLVILSELLPAAEAGLIEAFRVGQDRLERLDERRRQRLGKAAVGL